MDWPFLKNPILGTLEYFFPGRFCLVFDRFARIFFSLYDDPGPVPAVNQYDETRIIHLKNNFSRVKRF